MSVYEIDAKLFKTALTRMVKLSDGTSYHAAIRLEFNDSEVQLTAKNGFSLFNYHQELPLLSECSELTLGVNPNYLLTTIKHLPKESKVVRIIVKGRYDPFIVESEISNNTINLATPIRLN